MIGGARSLESSSFAIASNGFADGPAQALRDYLIAHGAGRVTTVVHPLMAEDGTHHEIREWRQGKPTALHRLWAPSRPPLTYPLDVLIPPIPPLADIWFGFNCLAAVVGIAARRLGRTGKAVYWAVDYVEDRFGASPMTRAYEALDGLCCRHADARFELSEAARTMRQARHAGGRRPLAPSRVVPMGAWVDRVPTTQPDGFKSRRIVYMGHLVPRQGVRMLIEALSVLSRRSVEFQADIVGRGPQQLELQEAVRSAGLDGVVTFRGFVEDHAELEGLLAAGSIGVAPYDPNVESFTRFADPGKLKAYLAAGLPIVTTNVAPNSTELEQKGSAKIVDYTPEAMAAGIEEALASPSLWQERRLAALTLARSFDWNTILDEALASVGFTSRPA
jgi:glycosyltransferase involved in cell wall biosynthesis